MLLYVTKCPLEAEGKTQLFKIFEQKVRNLYIIIWV
jgi:hypothetical protein